MHRRSPSYGSLADGAVDLPLGTRLPPRSPLSSALGQRTPPTCPASPLLAGTARPAVSPAPPAAPPATGAAPRSAGSTPARARGTACRALPQPDFPQSHVLNSIVTSVLESNLTAEQCFSAYGRMHVAPPLVGMTHGSAGAQHHHAPGHPRGAEGLVAETRPAGSVLRMAGAGAAAALGGGFVGHVNLISDLNNADFGLATCLATPMDPGTGLERRPVLAQQLPATTTAAARSAAYKLTSANDILQETSRFGDWVRRQRRRRKLERMQKLLVELGGDAVLGHLIDDTLLDTTDPAGRRRWRHELEPQDRGAVHGVGAATATAAGNGGPMGQGVVGAATAASGGASAAAAAGTRSATQLKRHGAGRHEEDEREEEELQFRARFRGFRDDMVLMD